MKDKLLIIVFTLALVFFANPLTVFAADTDPLAIETPEPAAEVPVDTYLSTSKRSIGANSDATTLSAAPKGLTRGVEEEYGWKNPFLPGQDDGWEQGDAGNVGYPVSDVSLPILLSMLLIYFVYRGVSSTKRKNSF